MNKLKEENFTRYKELYDEFNEEIARLNKMAETEILNNNNITASSMYKLSLTCCEYPVFVPQTKIAENNNRL